MRALRMAMVLLVVGCGDDEERIKFAPGEFLASTLAPEVGESVSYTVTGSFGIAEIYQGDERVSALTLSERVTSFYAVSSEPLTAVVYGNDEGEKKTLSPKLSPDLNPCGIAGIYEDSFDFYNTGNAQGVSCQFDPGAPLQAKVEILGGTQNAIFDGELLDLYERTAMGDPHPDEIATCKFSWVSDLWANIPLRKYVLVKAFDDRIELYLEKAGDSTGNSGCFTRWSKIFPRE